MTGRCVVRSTTIRGVQAVPVDVEVSVSSGIPSFAIVGMPDTSVSEARERVRAAVKASGFSVPAARITVNLAPGTLRKTGSGFDLPIAVALLAATGQVPPERIGSCVVVGELSLDGNVRAVPGLLASAVCAQNMGCALVCAADPACALRALGAEVRVATRLADFATGSFKTLSARSPKPAAALPDFADIVGHESAKRALLVAAAGDHGVLMVGPPGSGKSMLASRLPSILPPLTDREAIEVAVIHSVAGEDASFALGGRRPFRSPHHSASIAGLVGGGNPVRPGEITLAHRGVLFLDEVPLFAPSALQALRQPMERGCIVVTRADGSIELPARFSLVAAANPCPCGFLGDRQRTCTCTAHQIKAYRSRIGGPLLDRIDICIEVGRVPAKSVLEGVRGTSSSKMRAAVDEARAFASWRTSRNGGHGGVSSGESVLQAMLRTCALSGEASAFLEERASKGALSGRGIVRTLSVARTIADLDECQRVAKDHLCEAMTLRVRETAEEALR